MITHFSFILKLRNDSLIESTSMNLTVLPTTTPVIKDHNSSYLALSICIIDTFVKQSSRLHVLRTVPSTDSRTTVWSHQPP